MKTPLLKTRKLVYFIGVLIAVGIFAAFFVRSQAAASPQSEAPAQAESRGKANSPNGLRQQKSVNQENSANAQNGQETVKLFSFVNENLSGDETSFALSDKRLSIAAVNQREIKINSDVSNLSALGSNETDRLQIPLFDNQIFEAIRSEKEGFVQYKSDEFTWRGKISAKKDGADWTGDVILTFKGVALSGLIYAPTGVYEIIPQENFRHVLVQLDHNLFPECGGSIKPRTDGKDKEKVDLLEQIGSKQQPATKLFEVDKALDTNRNLEPQSPLADNGSQIDVMVVYSDDVRSALGGTTQAQAFAQQAVALTNTAYQNSGITPRVRLVYAREISYDETPGTLSAALDWIDSQTTVATDRNTYKADMVAFIVETGNDSCGLAYTMTTVSSSFASNAFSTSSRSCAVGNLSFPHELGHNQGSDHNPEDGSPASSNAYPYAYGHYVNGSFRTVMAYSNQCTSGCARVPYFSNPSVSYNGQSTGITDQRDNRRVLNNTANTVANFRDNGGVNCSFSAPSIPTWNDFGGTSSFVETTQSGCWWQATSSNTSWLTITSGSSGMGTGTVNYSVAANTGTSQRGATITVGGQSITVTQSGAPTCSYSLGSTSRTVDKDADNYSFGVSPIRNHCSWSASVTSGSSWLSITSGNSGTGSGSVAYAVAANTSPTSRTGTIVAGGQTFTVTQTGVSCSYYFLSPSINMSASGGNAGATVVTSDGCAWTATNNAPSWITITSGNSGTGNGGINFTVAANTSSTQRTGTISVTGGQTFTITQTGVSCVYNFLSPSINMNASGGNAGATVVTSDGCGWTVTNNAPSWITINSGSSGNGNGSVNFTVAANTSATQRSGKITVTGGQEFTVIQPGQSCSYSVPVSSFVGAGAGPFSVNVTAPAGCAWTAENTNNLDWLIITSGSGSGDGTVHIYVGANTSSQTRGGTVTIAGQEHTIIQQGASCSYSISSPSYSINSRGGNWYFDVTAPAGCAWSAVSDSDWLTFFYTPSSGSGNGTINYLVGVNNGGQRTGTITVAGLTHTVTQGAAHNISGVVSYGTTPTNQPQKFVSGVLLSASGVGSVSANSQLTTGAYTLSNLAGGQEYTVSLSKTGNIGGITPFDATLVLRHVAAGGGGANALSANQQLAADTNNSGTITPFDATQILRFVAANAQTINTGQVGNWKFTPPTRNYPTLSNSLSGENYQAILIGEINGSWTPPTSFTEFNENEASEQSIEQPETEQVAAASPATFAQPEDETLQSTDAEIAVPQIAYTEQDSIIVVPIMLDNNSGKSISSFNFAVNFDPAVLQLDAALPIDTDGTISGGFSVVFDTKTQGRLGIAAAAMENGFVNDGTLLNLRFKVIKAKGANSALTLSPKSFFEDSDGVQLTVTKNKGAFTINPPPAVISLDEQIMPNSKNGIGNHLFADIIAGKFLYDNRY